MWFMNWIVSRLLDTSGFFYELYLDSYSAGWPLEILADWFYYLSDIFAKLAGSFDNFNQWLISLSEQIEGFLNWTNIWLNIISYVPNLEDIRDWFYDWWGNVWGVITDWWLTTSLIVQGWIDVTKAWAQLWIDYLQDQVSALSVRVDDLLALIPDVSDIQAWFANWTGNVLSIVNTWWTSTLLEVQSLIDSTLRSWFPFYDELVALWGDIKLFFTDPEDWLYKSVDRIIERYW